MTAGIGSSASDANGNLFIDPDAIKTGHSPWLAAASARCAETESGNDAFTIYIDENGIPGYQTGVDKLAATLTLHFGPESLYFQPCDQAGHDPYAGAAEQDCNADQDVGTDLPLNVFASIWDGTVRQPVANRKIVISIPAQDATHHMVFSTPNPGLTRSSTHQGSIVTDTNGLATVRVNDPNANVPGATDSTEVVEAADPTLADASGSETATDSVMWRGGTITGIVRDAIPGEPIVASNVCVSVETPASGQTVEQDCAVASDGSYSVAGLAPGSYVVQFTDYDGPYAGQFFNGTAAGADDFPDAQPTTVSAGTTTVINAALVQGGKISGAVTDASTGMPATDGSVCVNIIHGNESGYVWSDCAVAAGGGAYTLGNIAPGQYTVVFADYGGPYELEYYNNAATKASATLVTVTAQHTTLNINAALQRHGIPPAPSAPSALPHDGQASVTWGAPAGDGGSPITGYDIEYSSNNGATWTSASSAFHTSTATTQTVTGLANGTSYTFRVAAINANGSSAYSPPSSPITPATVPGAPSGVNATAGNAQAIVSWTAPTETGGSPITGYTVQDSANGGATWTAAAWRSAAATPHTGTATSQVITGLTNGTAYLFRVAAISAAGTGVYSTASTPVTPADDHTKLRIGRNHTIDAGHRVTITTTLTDATTSTPVAGAHVKLLDRTSSSRSWTPLEELTTAGNGTASITVTPMRNTDYEWTFAGDATHAATQSGGETVTVRQVVTITLSKHRVSAGKKVRVFGTVTPDKAGETVTLQRLVNGSWISSGKTATLARTAGPHGTTESAYSFTIAEPHGGHFTLRIHRPATKYNAEGNSPAQDITVR